MFLFPALLLATDPALAGGIGIIGTGGVHADRVYGYEELANGDFDQQDPETQFNPHGGGGLEILLGDRDNRVMGVFRGYYVVDGPQSAPAAGSIYAIRDTSRGIGMATAGLQWTVWGEPDALAAIVTGNAGAGIFTDDRTEFLDLAVGGGMTKMLTTELQLQGNVTVGARYRKRFFAEAGATVGVRYLFD